MTTQRSPSVSPSPSSAEGWGVSVRKRAYPWKVSVCKRTRTLLTTGLPQTPPSLQKEACPPRVPTNTHLFRAGQCSVASLVVPRPSGPGQARGAQPPPLRRPLVAGVVRVRAELDEPQDVGGADPRSVVPPRPPQPPGADAAAAGGGPERGHGGGGVCAGHARDHPDHGRAAWGVPPWGPGRRGPAPRRRGFGCGGAP